MKCLALFLLSILTGCVRCWVLCPAPRAPDNGLAFISGARGAAVRFRCHPGHRMWGRPAAKCVKGKWSHPTPQCTIASERRPLFQWGEYGDGPKRLPLINGIWPADNQVLSLGMNGPRKLVNDEVDIAELRHRQLEELKKRRTIHPQKRRSSAKRKQDSRETVLSTDLVRHLVELRRRPVEEATPSVPTEVPPDSCLETVHRRQVPKKAPTISHGFVYRYVTKKSSMEVLYRCFNGYTFAGEAQSLYCKKGSWVGARPRCVVQPF